MAQLETEITVSVKDVPEVRAALAVTDQLADALRDVLAAVRGSNRLPDTTMQAERALDAVRAASKKANAALAAYDATRGVAGTHGESFCPSDADGPSSRLGAPKGAQEGASHE